MTTLPLLLVFAPTVALCVTWNLCLAADETPRWRLRAARRLESLAARLRRERTRPPDPFLALTVQTRLGIVANYARALEQGPRTFALAERIIATQLAYDQLLAEACGLAGVEVLPRAKGDPQERFREEVELTSRGWSW